MEQLVKPGSSGKMDSRLLYIQCLVFTGYQLSITLHTYKLCLLMHRVHNGKAPVYLTNIVTANCAIESRSCLRSASSDRYKIPQSYIRL